MTVTLTNKPARIRLLIADIDGTLVTKEKLLTPKSMQAVRKLQETGILFGITTGRPPKGTKMLVDSLPGLKFIAGFNGGIVVRRDYSLFKQNLLEKEAAQEVVNIILETTWTCGSIPNRTGGSAIPKPIVSIRSKRPCSSRPG